MREGIELIRSWHVLCFNYYMNLVEDCLCPDYRKKLAAKVEAHIRKFEATFEEGTARFIKGWARRCPPDYAESQGPG